MKFNKYAFLALIVGMTTVSCVEDEGNNTISEINEIEISGLEESYNCVSGEDTLKITPEIKGSLSDTDESNLAFEWFLCNKAIDKDHAHEVISRERNLSYKVTAAPSKYVLYLSVTDKTTNMKWEASADFNIISPFVRGFYLFGDKEDGKVGLDFVSMMADRDTFVVNDILNNDLNLVGAENLFFSGSYTSTSTRLWAMTKSGAYRVECGSAQTSFNLLPDLSNLGNLFFPTVETKEPYKLVDIWPYSYGSSNIDNTRTYRIMMTENEIFFGSMLSGEAFGNPVNCHTSMGKLYKPSKYVFYKPSTSVSSYVFYDEENHCFTRMNGATYSFTYTPKLSNEGTPFYWDQTQYASVRDLVFGQNGVGNAQRSYALMKDTNGDYFVYLFTVNSYSPTGTVANAERTIDLGVATDFSEADHYAFYSMQQILLYAVGPKLYAYDYARNECKLVKDFEAEITHLAMDYNSNNDNNHFVVATYDDTAKKGVVYGYNIEDNQNEINVTPAEAEVWETGLKVVKVEYRNCTY